MRRVAVAVVLMLVVATLAAPAVAANSERYSYITVEDVTIQFAEGDAVVTMNYKIDDGIRFLVLLLGKSDLKRKVLDVLNFEDAQIQVADLEHAVVLANNVSDDYGQGSYWFPEHRFEAVVPSLTVVTPRCTRHFTNVNELAGGFGYFSAE